MGDLTHSAPSPEVKRLIILSTPPSQECLRILEELCHKDRWSYSFEASDSFRDLSVETSGWVYLVDVQVLSTSIWPQLRVRLAQGSCSYVIVGQEIETAQIVSAMKDGAFEVLDSSDEKTRWLEVLENARNAQELWLQVYGGGESEFSDNLVGVSKPFTELMTSVRKLGPTVANVLVLGESGVGKERIAESLHQCSRCKGAFVAVNCAAIPKDLLEAELFGVKAGAFTGANKDRQGLVQQANGGTLFLDEIGEMELSMQPKLLRFLETRMARRVGDTQEYKAEVRFISATNRDLQLQATEGEFRADLYYRLSEVDLEVPPLRERKEDLPHLALAFMKLASQRFGKYFESIEPKLLKRMQDYEWPGNVRELKNTLDRFVVMYDGPVVRSGWWETPERHPHSHEIAIHALESPQPHGSAVPQTATISGVAGMGALGPVGVVGAMGAPISRKQKKQWAQELIKQSGGDYSWVAAQLGIHPTTLYRWRKQFASS